MTKEKIIAKIHGFEVTASELALGNIRKDREWVDKQSHRHRVTLTWDDRDSIPMVSTIDLDLAIRLMGSE